MHAEFLIRCQQFSRNSSPTDLRSVGLAQVKTEQITSAALHLQIWNIKQNKKIMFSPFLCKYDISARLPADHRYLPGLLLRQQPPPPLSHRLFIICYQQTSEPPKKVAPPVLRSYSRFLPRVKSISAQPYLMAAPSGLNCTAEQAVFLSAIEQRSNQQSHIKLLQSLLMKL